VSENRPCSVARKSRKQRWDGSPFFCQCPGKTALAFSPGLGLSPSGEDMFYFHQVSQKKTSWHEGGGVRMPSTWIQPWKSNTPSICLLAHCGHIQDTDDMVQAHWWVRPGYVLQECTDQAKQGPLHPHWACVLVGPKEPVHHPGLGTSHPGTGRAACVGRCPR
jgi:hypothetical protein